MRGTGNGDADRDASITLALAGDVMTARGIDQILPHPCDPTLHEPYVTSALDYVEMAERRSGPVPRPASFAYPWGDALEELEHRRPQLRIINLETAVTRADRPAPKGIHYRMSLYGERLILYGSGDFLNDYEGIRGHEAFRPELVLLYLPTVRSPDGALLGLTIAPFRIGRLRLERASGEDAAWLARTLNREGAAVGTTLEHVEGDGGPELRWKQTG